MPLAAIFGAGGRVGSTVARRLVKEGWSVAAISRQGVPSLKEEAEHTHTQLRLYEADMADTQAALHIFDTIESDFGASVQVVFYNAAMMLPSANVLGAGLDEFRKTMEVNIVTPYALAGRALKSFERGKVEGLSMFAFLYTGNGLSDLVAFPQTPPRLFSAAIGKTSAGFFIDAASQVHGPEGFRFYYLDERKQDGSPAYGGIRGETHADMVWQLINEKQQTFWRVPFIDGEKMKI
jgi:NAD(P)-dependent dehydrogenase (short-subunit alcohol dehydrogenase family)